jgi:hypothetical protein
MTTVQLRNRETLALADIRGATLRVTRGTLWITQEDDTRDVVLRDGDVWAVERQGLTIIEAQGETTLHATGRGFDRALRASANPGDLRAWARRVYEKSAAWLTLSPARPLPYY